MSNEIKIRRCWTWTDPDGLPNAFGTEDRVIDDSTRPAILMWKEDYEAMQKELEDFRKKAKLAEHIKNIIRRCNVA